jgi:hypothetical protein
VDGPDRAAVVRRLVALEGEGRLGSEQVRLATGALKVSERSVWRWVRQALSRRPGSRRWCSSREPSVRPGTSTFPDTLATSPDTVRKPISRKPRQLPGARPPCRRDLRASRRLHHVDQPGNARTREGPPRAPALRVVTASTSWPFAAAHYHCSKASYRVGSDRGSPNQGSTLLSKRVMAQIRSPVRVRT